MSSPVMTVMAAAVRPIGSRSRLASVTSICINCSIDMVLRSWAAGCARTPVASAARCRPIATAATAGTRKAMSVQAGDPAAKGLHVLPDLDVFLSRLLVHLAHAGEFQVGLQVAQRA